MRPKLSIVMPVFNRPQELSVMVESIMANAFADWELLAIDDGSDTEAVALLDDLSRRDSRIRMVRRDRTPKGAQTCRNMGLELAKGEFVIFYDSDDFIPPYALAARVEALDARPDLDFMVFPSGTFSDEGFTSAPSRYSYGYRIYADDLSAFAARTLPFIVWNNVYRTSALRRCACLWDDHLLSLQDADFNMQCLLKGLKYDYALTRPDYGYRVFQGTSVSGSLGRETHRKSHLYAIRKFYEAVQSKHGHRYDHSLYHGVLFIYNSVFSNGVDFSYAHQMKEIMQEYSRCWGLVFSLQLGLTNMLSHVLSPKRARQLPMILFLLWQTQNRRKRMRKMNALYVS